MLRMHYARSQRRDEPAWDDSFADTMRVERLHDEGWAGEVVLKLVPRAGKGGFLPVKVKRDNSGFAAREASCYLTMPGFND